LIEQAFGDELAWGGEHVLRGLRFLGRLGPLSLLLLAASSPVDGLLNGYVWEQDRRLVGNVTISCPTGNTRRWQLSNVAVWDAYRGRGIGRSLVETALDDVKRRGGHTAYLYVREDNPAAVHLYESLGFVALDTMVDLALEEQGSALGSPATLRTLRRLRPREGPALYELAVQARGAGQRWLGLPRRRRFVRAADERLFQGLSALWTGQRDTFWGTSTTDRRLRAGLSVRATSGWNRTPHRLDLWVHPAYRGRLEQRLAQDVMTLIAGLAPRRVFLSLPACEQAMIDALLERAFVQVRALTMMKLSL
jgi:ribosomal protein S18 acetylase RimI-like enzyme